MNDRATPLEKIPERFWPWLWLALAVVLFTPLLKGDAGSPNVTSDLAAIESLVHRHTFFINDSIYLDTIDKFKRGDLYFSQKSPIFHLVAAVPYWALTRLGWTLKDNPAVCIRVLTLLMVVAPMGWLLGLIFRHPWLARRGVRARAGLTLLYALGSLATPFAVTLNHYILAAACLMAAVNVITEKGLTTRAAALAAGFWISASLASDVPPAFLFGAGLGVAALARAPRRLPWLALGAAPLLLLYAALNQHLLGSPLPANLHEEKYQYFEGSYWAGLKAQAEAGHPGFYQASYARRLVHSTVGHKGIYWMMPLLALATVAALALARRRAPGWPLALAWAAFTPLAIVLTMRWAWDLSGGAYNIRHVLATIPPLYCVLGHPALGRPGRALRGVAGVAAGWGVLIAGLGLLNPWSHNTLSAWPPLENVARWTLRHPLTLPTDWIGPLIRATSVTPEVGWLDLGEEYLGAGMQLPERAGRVLMNKAELALRESIELKDREAVAYYHLGIAQDQAGRPFDAMRTLQALLAFDPNNVGAWNNLGQIALLRVGNLEVARDAFRHVLALSPDNPTALFGELVIGEREGRPDRERLREALRRHPADARLKSLAASWGMKP